MSRAALLIAMISMAPVIGTLAGQNTAPLNVVPDDAAPHYFALENAASNDAAVGNELAHYAALDNPALPNAASSNVASPSAAPNDAAARSTSPRLAGAHNAASNDAAAGSEPSHYAALDNPALPNAASSNVASPSATPNDAAARNVAARSTSLRLAGTHNAAAGSEPSHYAALDSTASPAAAPSNIAAHNAAPEQSATSGQSIEKAQVSTALRSATTAQQATSAAETTAAPQTTGQEAAPPQQRTPLQQTPLQQTPLQQTPLQQTPLQQTPLQQTPLQQTPLQQTPPQQTPLQQTPPQQTPLQQTPLQQTPLQPTPLQQTPLQQAPPQRAPLQRTPPPATVQSTATRQQPAEPQITANTRRHSSSANAQPSGMLIMPFNDDEKLRRTESSKTNGDTVDTGAKAPADQTILQLNAWRDPGVNAGILNALATPGKFNASRNPSPALGQITAALNTPPPPGKITASWWAPAASAVLPGAGQGLLRQQRSVAYLVAEVFIVLQASRVRKDYENARQRYRDIAADVARLQFGTDRPVGPWEYYETLADASITSSGNYNLAVGGKFTPEPDETTFNGRQWLFARELYWTSPTETPAEASVEYQKALAFYQSHAVQGSYRWSWRDNQNAKELYVQTISEANHNKQRQSSVVALLAANHLLSLVDAYVTVRLRRYGGAGLVGASIKSELRPTGIPGDNSVTAAMRVSLPIPALGSRP